MRRIAILLLLSVMLGGGLVAAWLAATHLRRDRPAAELRFPKDPAERILWPQDHAWVWSADLPSDSPKKQVLSCIVRAVDHPLRNNETHAVGTRVISEQESQKTITVGSIETTLGTASAEPAIVGVQLINLADLGLPTDPQKGTLRLLLTLSWGGATTIQRGKESMIDGIRVSGSATNGKRWEGDELHLMNFFVVAKDRFTTYDVVLIRSEDEHQTPHQDK